MRKTLSLALICTAVVASVAAAQTSHDGWPKINGMLLMNKTDSARPLDARPGHDPFDGQDPSYSCDAIHKRGSCQRRMEPSGTGRIVTSRPGHNKLLGGHGNDTIYAGNWGDVLWGDYKPSGQPTTQIDNIVGGNGKDFIYASHGTNNISAGGGNDFIKAHYGRGSIDCGGGNDILYISRRAQKGYKISNCERISHKTLGY